MVRLQSDPFARQESMIQLDPPLVNGKSDHQDFSGIPLLTEMSNGRRAGYTIEKALPDGSVVLKGRPNFAESYSYIVNVKPENHQVLLHHPVKKTISNDWAIGRAMKIGEYWYRIENVLPDPVAHAFYVPTLFQLEKGKDISAIQPGEKARVYSTVPGDRYLITSWVVKRKTEQGWQETRSF